MMRLAILLIFLQISFAEAQKKYWVYHHNLSKAIVTEYLKKNQCTTIIYSRWLKAFSVESPCMILEGDLPPFIKSVEQVVTFKRNRTEGKVKMGFALEQINAGETIKRGLNAKGVKIGIIDGGFLDAPEDSRLKYLFEGNQVKAYRDFITPDLKDYGGSAYYGDDHGNEVWHMIAGKDPDTEVQFGLATGADFYLARTDDGRADYHIEEDFLVAALEWMDSLSVKLVNISIGYSTGFENPEENYRPEDMDGQSVALTRAAQIAANEKGMLLVVAGGNDGNDEGFQVVSTPADAKDVLTVGATGYKVWQKLNYSSIGADFTPYVKPEVSCFSTQGTSFSAPIITGMAGVLWQQFPNKTNHEIKDLIISSTHLYHTPNNYVGYGVPDMSLIGNSESIQKPQMVQTSKKKVKIEIDTLQTRIVLFHKKDSVQVIRQEVMKIGGPILKIAKPEGASQTTVVYGRKSKEIIWK